MSNKVRPELTVDSDPAIILEKLRKYHRTMTPGFWTFRTGWNSKRDEVLQLHCDEIYTSTRHEDREGIAWIRNNLGGILRLLVPTPTKGEPNDDQKT